MVRVHSRPRSRVVRVHSRARSNSEGSQQVEGEGGEGEQQAEVKALVRDTKEWFVARRDNTRVGRQRMLVAEVAIIS